MIADPKIFYKTYLDDYHKFKTALIKNTLENLEVKEKELFGRELDKEEREAFRMSLKSDMRQTYFHAIESFFELFFALCPDNKPGFDDLNILFNLTNSNWQANYKKIVQIADGSMNLDFLDDQIVFQDHVVTVGHYLFYFGLFNREKMKSTFFKKVKDSIAAIKYGIKMIAADFVDREEYNSYKHGLRIIPSITELAIADASNMEIKMKWNMENSMSFYSKTKSPDEIKIKTKLLDSDRDYSMAWFCSNLISNMVCTRRVSIYKEQYAKENKPTAIGFFGRKEIQKCAKMNVEIQDIIYTVRRVYTDSPVTKPKKS